MCDSTFHEGAFRCGVEAEHGEHLAVGDGWKVQWTADAADKETTVVSAPVVGEPIRGIVLPAVDISPKKRTSKRIGKPAATKRAKKK